MASLRKSLAVLIFVVGPYGAGVARDLKPETQFTTRFKDQVLSLRHPLIAQNQNYGFDGEPLTGTAEGPWTLFGRIQISEIVADDKELRVKGTRVLCEFTKKGLELVHDKERVTITVRLTGPLASEDEAVAALGRVFALTPEEIVNSAPDYWRDFLAKDLLGRPGPEKTTLTANSPKDRPASNPGTAAGDGKQDAAKERVFRIGEANVQVPRPQYTPEPEFTEVARKMRYDGVVGVNVIVDPMGRITAPQIVHPLGLGLDESAIATIRQWKLTPGTHDGEPVAVALYIEVDYHLYKK